MPIAPPRPQLRLDAVSGGRLLLVTTGASVTVAAPLLTPSVTGWLAVLAVSGAMIAVLLASLLINWDRLPRPATLAFPIAVFAGLAALGLAEPTLTNALTGVLTGAFVYTGLTQAQGASAVVVPLGAVTFVAMNGGLDRPIAIRVVIGVLVWTLIVEILAAFSTQHRRQTRLLSAAAHTDPLTGVGNRRDLDHHLAAATPDDVVVLCDLDHFKALNDTRGHQAGDDALRDFAAVVRRQLREGDYCARYGGEEFLIILGDTSVEFAAVVTERLRRNWARVRPDITFSAGIAACRSDRSIVRTIAAADDALYRAKQSGRDAAVVEGRPRVGEVLVPAG